MFKKVVVLSERNSASPSKAVKNNSNEDYSLFPVRNCGGWDGWEGANTRDRQGEVSYHSHERPTIITQDVLGKHMNGAVSMPILVFSCFLLVDFLLKHTVLMHFHSPVSLPMKLKMSKMIYDDAIA